MSAESIFSIVFYIGIAVSTCLLAVRVAQCRSAGNRYLTKVYLLAIFAVLFLPSVLRFSIGNDYEQYTQTAHEAYVHGYVVTEAGFNVLVRVIYSLFGCECYEVVFAVFALATLVLFLKALYEQSVDFAFSYFLFMMLGLYFQTYNTVRYYLALALALYAMRYVLRRDWIKFAFVIVIAALFHKSVLLVIPVYAAASYLWKKWMYAAILVLSALCLLGRSFVLKVALLLYPSYENTEFLEGGTSLSGIVVSLAMLVLYVWYSRRYEQGVRDHELAFYAQLNFLAAVSAIFFWFLPVVSRIVYYFNVSGVLMLPRIVVGISDAENVKKVKTIIIIASVIYFTLFLATAGQDGVGLLPYRSWLFESERYSY